MHLPKLAALAVALLLLLLLLYDGDVRIRKACPRRESQSHGSRAVQAKVQAVVDRSFCIFCQCSSGRPALFARRATRRTDAKCQEVASLSRREGIEAASAR